MVPLPFALRTSCMTAWIASLPVFASHSRLALKPDANNVFAGEAGPGGGGGGGGGAEGKQEKALPEAERSENSLKGKRKKGRMQKKKRN